MTFDRWCAFRVALLLAVVSCGASPARVQSAPPSEPPASPHVVLISIDALKPEYFLDPARGAKIPNLRALMATGIFGELESVWPTVTYPSHTTMVTGVNPSRHGILANHPFDPLANNQDGWTWYAQDITAPTLWELARAHHETVGAIYWPVTVGAAIDWNLPQYWRAKNAEDDKLLRALATPPGIAQEIEQRYRSLPSETRSDAAKADAADYVMRTYAPNLMLVYYSDLDTIQHETGPFSKGAYATLEKLDIQVGRLVTAAHDARIATTFIVVSDHGFADVDRIVRPAVALAKAGLITVDASGRVRDWRAALLAAGGTAGVILKNPNDMPTREKVEATLRDLMRDPANGIARIDDEAVVAKVEGFKGASFILEASPGFYFGGSATGELVSASGDRGMHGYPPDHPDMHASIIASGVGVAHRGNIGLVHTVDIAPSIAALLGFSMPSFDASIPSTEGHVLPGIERRAPRPDSARDRSALK